MPDDDPAIEDDTIITCWCGAKGTFQEMFDAGVYNRGCDGTGTLICICGGDFCVCHHHGEVECEGCDDCERERDEYDD